MKSRNLYRLQLFLTTEAIYDRVRYSFLQMYEKYDFKTQFLIHDDRVQLDFCSKRKLKYNSLREIKTSFLIERN